MKKRIFLAAVMLLSALTAYAQGGNTGFGGPDDSTRSLAERVFNLEQKHDNFHLFINTATSFQAVGEKDAPWESAFRAKYLRLEVKGGFGQHLIYRLRHRLNASNASSSYDSFSKATDIMMVGWQFNPKWTLMGGKLCQSWGGFEYDENPLYIYEYCELLNHMEIFFGGVALAWTPIPGQEFIFNITNPYNDNFYAEYGGAPFVLKPAQGGGMPAVEALEAARHPYCYIFNWNGSLFGGLVETRWSAGITTEAKGYNQKMIFAGTKLVLPKLQWYVDYMGAWDGLDRFRIASPELGAGGETFTDVRHQSFVTKANWQFAPQWNLMAKGMYETVHTEGEGTYRSSLGAVGSLEYYPMKDQDFRIFAAWVGKAIRYDAATGLPDAGFNRIELGFMYRIKCF